MREPSLLIAMPPSVTVREVPFTDKDEIVLYECSAIVVRSQGVARTNFTIMVFVVQTITRPSGEKVKQFQFGVDEKPREELKELK